MVAYDRNAPESRSLQGWLTHDDFILRSTFGAPTSSCGQTLTSQG